MFKECTIGKIITGTLTPEGQGVTQYDALKYLREKTAKLQITQEDNRMTSKDRKKLKNLKDACIVIGDEGPKAVPHPQLTNDWKPHIERLVGLAETGETLTRLEFDDYFNGYAEWSLDICRSRNCMMQELGALVTPEMERLRYRLNRGRHAEGLLCFFKESELDPWWREYHTAEIKEPSECTLTPDSLDREIPMFSELPQKLLEQIVADGKDARSQIEGLTFSHTEHDFLYKN